MGEKDMGIGDRVNVGDRVEITEGKYKGLVGEAVTITFIHCSVKLDNGNNVATLLAWVKKLEE